MARMFALSPADAEFVESAPQRFVYESRLAAPIEAVWESLASDESVSAWGPMVSSVAWQDGAGQRGVGTRREVVLPLGMRMREEFFRWDEGRGYSFFATEGSAPGLRRFAEDYVLEPDGDGTRFRWIVAMEPKPWAAPTAWTLRPVTRRAFGRMAADGRRYFAAS